MNFETLISAIEAEIGSFSLSELKKARENLTNRYRVEEQRASITARQETWMQTAVERISYLVTRMPATYKALEHLLQQIPATPIHSVLDLGAGPGTGTWAASAVFPSLIQATLIEQDADLIEIGQRLAKHSAFPKAEWKQGCLSTFIPLPHDLVIASYVLGELKDISEVVKKSWDAAQQFLILVEPGSQKGFATILQARQQVLDLGGYLVGPCPHAGACPMPPGDWCHFSKRVERTRLHRQCKEGSLGYEDEKFSYAIFSKQPYPLSQARILEHPQKRSGHVHLRVCTSKGIQKAIISKRHKDLYKQAQDAKWGDTLKVV
ncbi:small ribosomal subunit Rsm22 family protein [Parachlamydia sp. AcF125]|uniref:small ribosomal subunit Rsm22 family protein n=1 Tax=Parachlamydia sp. AcF125 TaxID=2795736 RepID=UPI001BC8D43E|nr:small ribosomal subunit Rsm22 family protein [Parachlamydia sp. AcF125]MBS4167808.1 Trans-aconitate 2-methyltransferase [Parachlamydia sp. AcF125]